MVGDQFTSFNSQAPVKEMSIAVVPSEGWLSLCKISDRLS